MRVDLFDFDLPPDRIALRPARPRDAARLLVVNPGHEPELMDCGMRDLPELLRPGDALVFNDTRVIPAQLEGRRIGRGPSEPRVEVTLHRRVDGSTWRALVRGARKLAVGDRIRFGEDGRVCFLGVLDAEVVGKEGAGEVTLAFSFHGAVLDEAIAERGRMPIPPYIATRRSPDEADRHDYQTVFAREDGAVAAPTAGLHFTPELLSSLRNRGVTLQFVTLHVGVGTFLPIKVEETTDHKMHSEHGSIDPATADALNEVRDRGGRVVAVGTTSLRLLESAAGEGNRIEPFRGETDLFIVPGYRFRVVDLLVTNFHLPRSTLFMLVAAFAGVETIRRAYQHAIAEGYRFYSYGDASLLHRANP